LIKEILINKPEDIISFCSDYFKNKQEEMQNNLSRVTTFPIIINVKSNNGSNKKRLSIFQKKFVSQKSNAKKELIELSKNYNPEMLREKYQSSWTPLKFTVQEVYFLNRKDQKVVSYKLLGGDFFEKENAFFEPMTVWNTPKKENDAYTPNPDKLEKLYTKPY